MSGMRSFVLAMLALGSLTSGLLTACANAEPGELLFEAKGAELPSEGMMDATRAIAVQRLAMLGVPGARVEREGAKRILVRLDDRADEAAVRTLLDRRGRIEFRLVEENVSQAQIMAGEPTLNYEVLAYPGGGEGARIAVQRRAILTGERIRDARPSYNVQGMPTVDIIFDEAGGRRFAIATRDSVGKLFAIVIDDEVISAPVINEPILGGQASIAGDFTQEAANQLAIALRSGALPVDLEVVEGRGKSGN